MKVGKSNILCVMKCIISLPSIRCILETNNILQILICNPFYYIIVKKSANNHEKIYQHFSKKAPNRFFSFLLIFVQKGLNILTMQMVSIGTVENDTFFQGRGGGDIAIYLIYYVTLGPPCTGNPLFRLIWQMYAPKWVFQGWWQAPSKCSLPKSYNFC